MTSTEIGFDVRPLPDHVDLHHDVDLALAVGVEQGLALLSGHILPDARREDIRVAAPDVLEDRLGVDVAHPDDEHLVVARGRVQHPARAGVVAGESAALLGEALEGRPEQRVEVDLVEAELLAREEGVDVARRLGHLAELREREVHLLACVGPHHAHRVVHHVRVDALEDAALGVGLAHAHLVERLVVLEAVVIGGERDAEEGLVV